MTNLLNRVNLTNIPSLRLGMAGYHYLNPHQNGPNLVSVDPRLLHGFQPLLRGCVAEGNFVAAATGPPTPVAFMEFTPPTTRDQPSSHHSVPWQSPLLYHQILLLIYMSSEQAAT